MAAKQEKCSDVRCQEMGILRTWPRVQELVALMGIRTLCDFGVIVKIYLFIILVLLLFPTPIWPREVSIICRVVIVSVLHVSVCHSYFLCHSLLFYVVLTPTCCSMANTNISLLKNGIALWLTFSTYQSYPSFTINIPAMMVLSNCSQVIPPFCLKLSKLTWPGIRDTILTLIHQHHW